MRRPHLETHQPADRGVKHQGDEQAHVTADRLDLPQRFFLDESSGVLVICRGAGFDGRIALVAVRHHARVFHERRRRADHSERTGRHALLRDLFPGPRAENRAES